MWNPALTITVRKVFKKWYVFVQEWMICNDGCKKGMNMDKTVVW